jgi:hypothetical protein
MKIVTVHFDYPAYNGVFKRLINVFMKTAKHYMPEVPIELIRVDPPDTEAGIKKTYVANTEKLRLWVEALKRSDGEVVLMDCDMMFLGDIGDGFQYDFDIGYTIRHKSRIPFNGGVIFVRVSKKVVNFFEELLEVNNRMYRDPKLHEKYRKTYCGLNQAAFGYMLENYRGPVKLLALPSRVYNAVDDTWPHALNGGTKVIHIKSRLRKHCLGEDVFDPRYKPIWRLWQKWEKREDSNSSI